MKCQKCGVHKGTEKWLGYGSTMDYIHGNYLMWCKCCCLKAQLDYAQEQIKILPKNITDLKAKLKDVKCG